MDIQFIFKVSEKILLAKIFLNVAEIFQFEMSSLLRFSGEVLLRSHTLNSILIFVDIIRVT